MPCDMLCLANKFVWYWVLPLAVAITMAVVIMAMV